MCVVDEKNEKDDYPHHDETQGGQAHFRDQMSIAKLFMTQNSGQKYQVEVEVEVTPV